MAITLSDPITPHGKFATKGTSQTWTWIAQSDSIDTHVGDIIVFLNSEGLGLGTACPDDSSISAQDIDIKRSSNSPLVWEISTSYAANESITGGSGSSGDVWNVEFSEVGAEYTKDLYQDFSDTPLPMTNSAGQPLDPTVTETFADNKFSIKFNTNDYCGNLIKACRNKTNREALSFTVAGVSFTFAPNTVQVMGESGCSTVYNGNTLHWTNIITLVEREQTYLTKFADMGTMEIGTDNKLDYIKAKNGDNVATPVALDLNGKAKPIQSNGSPPEVEYFTRQTTPKAQEGAYTALFQLFATVSSSSSE